MRKKRPAAPSTKTKKDLAPSRRSSEKQTGRLLASFGSIVDCIADLLGPTAEVALHKVDTLEDSIIKIRNGPVTGRKVGDHMSGLGLKMMKDAQNGLDTLGNYRSRTESGRLLKSNAAVLRDKKKRIIALLGINMDITVLRERQEILSAFCMEDSPLQAQEQRFRASLDEIVLDIINEVVGEAKTPVHLLSREEKIHIVAKLKRRGIFYAKGATEKAARAIGVSVPCIYNYLKEAS